MLYWPRPQRAAGGALSGKIEFYIDYVDRYIEEAETCFAGSDPDQTADCSGRG
jgi:hypothetical protein